MGDPDSNKKRLREGRAVPPAPEVRRWVICSNLRSIARHNISFLAIIETGAAVTIYVALAVRYERQWLLLLAAVVAPFLLLRSKAAIADSLAVVRSDIRLMSGEQHMECEPRLFGGRNRSVRRLGLLSLLVCLAAVSARFTQSALSLVTTTGGQATLAILLASLPWTAAFLVIGFAQPVFLFLEHPTDKRVSLVGVLASTGGICIGAWLQAGFSAALMVLTSCALTSGLVRKSFSSLYTPPRVAQGPVAAGGTRGERFARRARRCVSRFPEPVVLSAFFVGFYFTNRSNPPTSVDVVLLASGLLLVAGLMLQFVAKLERPYRDESREFGRWQWSMHGSIFVWSFPGHAVGFMVRTVTIRVWATLRHLNQGWHALPDNWRDNLWVIDFLHPPELLPRIGRVSKSLTAMDGWRQLSNPGVHPLFKLAIAVLMPVLYVGLLYRWSLKSTLWLWWPVVLLMAPPFFRMTHEQIRVRTAVTARSTCARVKVLTALAFAVWLIQAQVPQLTLPQLGPEVVTIVEFLNQFIPPNMGVRWLSLMSLSIATIVIWTLASGLTAAFEEPLKDSGTFATLERAPLEIFMGRARHIERVRVFGIVCGIVLVYSTALNLSAMWYPGQVHAVVPLWLLSIL